MVDFKITTRHRCRNPKCRSKLPAPVSNEREAFCCRGCYESFYLHRCRCCEAPIEQKGGQQRFICKRSKCKSAWQSKTGFGRFLTRATKDASAAIMAPKTPDFIGVESPIEGHRAMVNPHDHCAVCGRDDDLIDRKVPNGWLTVCRDCAVTESLPEAKPEPAPLAVETIRNPAAEHWTGTWPVLRAAAAGAPITGAEYHCAVIDAGFAVIEDARLNKSRRPAKAFKRTVPQASLDLLAA